jgi:hypothetical protein
MIERGLIFQGWGVQAIQKDIKIHTRRVIPLTEDEAKYLDWERVQSGPKPVFDGLLDKWRKVDRIWVRETWWKKPENITERNRILGADTWEDVYYDATDGDFEDLKEWGWKKKPSIHMPKKYARIWLRLKDVRIERVQEITEDDARAEGINLKHFNTMHSLDDKPYTSCFKWLWFVYVLEFRRIK